jgi:hypothetical protein
MIHTTRVVKVLVPFVPQESENHASGIPADLTTRKRQISPGCVRWEGVQAQSWAVEHIAGRFLQ